MKKFSKWLLAALLWGCLLLPTYAVQTSPAEGLSLQQQTRRGGLPALRGEPSLVTGELNIEGLGGAYKVDETGVAIYDEGGKDGEMPDNKRAVATFHPNVAGKAVELAFSLVDLTGDGSSEPKKGYINIYAGDKVDASKLLGTLQVANNGTKPTYMAEVITIEVQSSTRSWGKKSGFAATVKQVEKVQPVVNAVLSEPVKNPTVISSMQMQPIAWVNVQVSLGVGNPITCAGMKLTLSSPASNITKLHVTYVGAKNEVLTPLSSLVDVVPQDRENSISFNQELKSGDNWFLLLADVASCLSNDTEISVTVQSANFAGGDEKNIASPVALVSKVNNEVVSRLGQQEYVVCDGIAATYVPTIVGRDPYIEPVEGEQKVIFRSADPTKAVKIDFSDLQVASARPPQLIVYRGTTVKEEAILFKKEYGETAKINEHVVLKGSPDVDGGALMVIFDVKTTSQWASGKSFLADVTLFTPTDLKITSIESTHDGEPGDLYAMMKGVRLLRSAFTMEGDRDIPKLQSLKFALKGGDAIEKLYLYVSSKDPLPTYKPEECLTLLGESTTPEAITLNTPLDLHEGKRYFWVVADFKGYNEVVDNSKFDIALAGYTCVGKSEVAVSEAQGAPAGEYTLRKAYLMESGTGHEVVVDGSALFFDDGGPSKNITRDFNGAVTFKPKDNSKRLQIVFEELELFNTSSVGYNDVLNIYSGAEAQADNLLATLLMEKETAAIPSVAADGSLTVTLKSVAGSPKAGFRARVEEVAKTAMQYVATETAKGDEEATEGQKGVLMQWFNLKTQGNLTPLQLKQATFSTVRSSAYVSQAQLYYTGRTKSLAGVTPFACSKDDNNIMCDLSATPVALREGDNWLAIKYDLESCIANGTEVLAKLTKVKLSGTEQAINVNEGKVKVNNVVRSKVQTQEITLCNDWTFTHTGGNKYEGGSADQKTIFRPNPSRAGEVVQLVFSSFEVQYVSSSYGAKAKFEIYQGASATGAPIWKVDNTDKATKGPGMPIRGDLAKDNGALTIVFNPVETASFNCKKGWSAVASHYKSAPMAVESVTVEQGAERTAETGAEDVVLLHVNVLTKGDQTPLKLKGLTVDLKGSHVNTKALRVFRSKGDTFDKSKDEKLVEVDNPADGTIKLTFGTQPELGEGANHLWVVVDVKEMSECQMNKPLDAKVTAYTLDGTTDVAVTGADPAGEVGLLSIYNIAAGEKELKIEGPIAFYDEGGKDANYTKNFKGVTTFVPKAGEVAQITFNKMSKHYLAKLVIYSGKSKENNLGDVRRINTAKPDPVVYRSNTMDGVLVADWSVGKAELQAGWEAIVTSEPKQPLVITAESHAVSTTLMANATGQRALGIKLVAKGDASINKLESFTLDLTGSTNVSDISAARIYASGKTPGYLVTSKSLADGTKDGNTLTFDVKGANVSIDYAGEYNFWVLLDIDKQAVAENKVALALTKVKFDTHDVTPASTTPAEFTIAKGLEGTFTIGEGGDYKDWKAAAEALRRGISGPVTLQFLDSENLYDSIYVVNVAGTSSKNPLTITSKSGDKEKVKIYRGRVSGTPYVTISNVTFASNLKAREYLSLLLVENASHHVTIKGNQFKLEPGYPYGGNVARAEVLTIGTHNTERPEEKVDYVTIEGNSFDCDQMAIRADGKINAKTPIPPCYGLTVTKNVITQKQPASGLRGAPNSLFLQHYVGMVVDGNIINVEQKESLVAAIRVGVADVIDGADFVVRNNRIQAKVTDGDATAVYIEGLGASCKRLQIYNNAIEASVGDSRFAYGISSNTKYYNNSVKDALIAYNSIRIDAKKGAGIDLNKGNFGQNTRIINNIVQVDELPAYWLTTTQAGELKFSHNTLHSSVADKLVRIGTGYETIDTWKARTNVDAETEEERKIDFAAQGVASLDALQGLNTAKPLVEVKTDLLGVVRDAEYPTRGAYEWEVAAKLELSAGYPMVKNITEKSATLYLKAAKACNAFVLVQKADIAEPTPAVVLDSPMKHDLLKLTDAMVELTGLNSNTLYKAYVVLKDGSGPLSDQVYSVEFKTNAQPTAVSTFELAVTAPKFTDATQSFTGFEVVDITGNEPSKKAAKLTGTEGSITIDNEPVDGAVIAGFFLRSNGEATYVAKAKDGDKPEVTLASTEGVWRYVPLKQLERILSLTIKKDAPTELLIDDFAAQPKELKVILSGKHVTTPEAKQGETIELQAEVAGGVQPYSYSWKDASGTEIGTEQKLATAATRTQVYTVTVTDAWNHAATAQQEVFVLGGLTIATFEDLGLPDNSCWKDGDEQQVTWFNSGTFSFPQYRNRSWDSWNGFAYSSEKSTDPYDGNFHHDCWNPTGKGANGSKTWGVLYFSTYNINPPKGPYFKVTNDPEGVQIPGVWVNNTSWLVHATEHGPVKGDNDPYAKGDYFYVTFTGDNNKYVTYYTAKYEGDDTDEYYVLKDWAWVDLSPLGKVKSVSVKVSGSRSNAYGELMPSYICIDDLGSTRPERTVAKQTLYANGSIDLSALTNFEGKAIHYEKEGSWDWAGTAQIAINKEKIIVEGWDGVTPAEKTFTVKVSQHGRTEWLNVPIELATKPANPFVFLGLNVEGKGSAKVLYKGAELAKDGTVTPGETIKLETKADSAWQLLPENVKVEGATAQGDGVYMPNADFSVSVTFTAMPPPPAPQPKVYTLTSIEQIGKGTIKVTNQAGESLAERAELPDGTILTIVAKPGDGYEMAPDGLKVTGAKQQPDKTWKVEGDVTIKVIFREKAKTPPSAVESVLLADATVAPNPFTGHLNVRASSPVARCVVYSVMGRPVYAAEQPGADFTLDLGGLPSGLYLLWLHDAQGGVKVMRVIKQ